MTPQARRDARGNHRGMMTRGSLGIALCVLILACAGCTQPQGPTGDYGSVAGVVSSSSGPIASAKVCIDFVDCQTTASNGSYTISTVPGDPPGVTETITATAANYQDYSAQVHVTAGQQTPFNITMVHV